jgi:methionyl aminopeptidase
VYAVRVAGTPSNVSEGVRDFVAKKTRALYHELNDRPKVFRTRRAIPSLPTPAMQAPTCPALNLDSQRAGATISPSPIGKMRPMQVTIKSPAEQEQMRVAGRLAADVLDMITPFVVPGVTTDELNARCHDHIVNVQKAVPAPLNYRGFPKSICTSVNHVVCHGIPSDKRLKQGDIINLDITVIKDGWHGDTSRMMPVGKVIPAAQRLMEITHEAMWIGIRRIRPGARLGDLGAAIQTFVEGQHLSVVREYCGHGIGRIFHEDPQVLHYGEAGTGIELVPGMIFTVEPMVNAGKRHVRLLPDGWTVITKDHSLSAQWEHTVLVTDTGYEVLTLGATERQS